MKGQPIEFFSLLGYRHSYTLVEAVGSEALGSSPDPNTCFSDAIVSIVGYRRGVRRTIQALFYSF